jgi:Smg protein
MKENIFDVLIYLFENYLDDDIELIPDSEGIKTELIQAGFKKTEVNTAFTWLETLVEQSPIKPSIPSAFRIFSPQEEIKLDLECRDFLLFLERNAILNATTREIVIDRAMALENKNLTLLELKWTVLLVLLSQSDDDEAYCKMEDLIYDLTPFLVH